VLKGKIESPTDTLISPIGVLLVNRKRAKVAEVDNTIKPKTITTTLFISGLGSVNNEAIASSDNEDPTNRDSVRKIGFFGV
jgi:hypothetical protein